MKKLILALFFFLMISASFWLYKNYQQNIFRIRLAQKLITKSLSDVQSEYSQMDCLAFTDDEEKKGFEALVTFYCRPKAEDFIERHDFLCAVGLNCSCPNGRVADQDCKSSSLGWSSCVDFDDKNAAYCHQTASQVEPGSGQAAADWSCFPKGSKVTIGDKEYAITDKGSVIKGRRFDVWVDDCDDSINKTGIYKVKK